MYNHLAQLEEPACEPFLTCTYFGCCKNARLYCNNWRVLRMLQVFVWVSHVSSRHLTMPCDSHRFYWICGERDVQYEVSGGEFHLVWRDSQMSFHDNISPQNHWTSANGTIIIFFRSANQIILAVKLAFWINEFTESLASLSMSWNTICFRLFMFMLILKCVQFLRQKSTWARCCIPSTGGTTGLLNILSNYPTTVLSPATRQLTFVPNAFNRGIVTKTAFS